MSKWVTVLTVGLPQHMWVIRTRLESEGIECFAKDELTVQSDNLYSNAVGGVKLQVQEDDVPRAIEILKDETKKWMRSIAQSLTNIKGEGREGKE